MKTYLIKNGLIINEGKQQISDILIEQGRISKLAPSIAHPNAEIIDATGLYVMPGVIDDQVHFREPGLTHKGNIASESRAAVAGGTTTFMEMPNTVPNTLSQTLLEDKYTIAANTSAANYSFFMGVSNDNYDEVMKTDKNKVCGLKIFMGSSTGNMLVDNLSVLEKVFCNSELLVATHCEDEQTVRARLEMYKQKYGDNILPEHHAEIRNEEACLKSSTLAVQIAKKCNARLHILHISTEEELALFRNDIPLKDKRITSEACTHHLWFDKSDYAKYGFNIKWNPSVKEARHKKAILQALIDDRIDVLATDHAPHTIEEKSGNYLHAHSGGPLVQHALQAILEFVVQGKLKIEKAVEKLAHAPAICFQIKDRGFLREGYWADIVLVKPNTPYTVSKNNLLYKCAWSPFEGTTFSHSISSTFVSGRLAYHEGKVLENGQGMRIEFER